LCARPGIDRFHGCFAWAPPPPGFPDSDGATVWPGLAGNGGCSGFIETSRPIGQAPLASQLTCPICCPSGATVPAGFAETF
jgi:hypothetical protein